MAQLKRKVLEILILPILLIILFLTSFVDGFALIQLFLISLSALLLISFFIKLFEESSEKVETENIKRFSLFAYASLISILFIIFTLQIASSVSLDFVVLLTLIGMILGKGFDLSKHREEKAM